MIVVRYAVCSAMDRKPVTRGVYENRDEAERRLQSFRNADREMPETEYWIAELGPECDEWRWLAEDKAS